MKMFQLFSHSSYFIVAILKRNKAVNNPECRHRADYLEKHSGIRNLCNSSYLLKPGTENERSRITQDAAHNENRQVFRQEYIIVSDHESAADRSGPALLLLNCNDNVNK